MDSFPVFKPFLTAPLPSSSSSSSPPLSALTKLIQSHPTPAHLSRPEHTLALQVAHNLHFQHLWTDVRLQIIPPLPSSTSTSDKPSTSQIILSGLPPKRLYIHPDEQIEFLQLQKQLGNKGSGDEGLKPEREWVLPSHLRQKWSLRKVAHVFDSISVTVPFNSGQEILFGDRSRDQDGDKRIEREGEDDGGENNKWRLTQPKRLLLATVDDDSTTVYYIMHDGLQKPRQN